MLDHDDRVCSRWEGRSGHDFYGLARPYFAAKKVARTYFADDFELTRKIGRAYRKTVADRAGKGRGIAVGGRGLSKNAARRFRCRDSFYRGELTRGANMAKDGIAGVGKRQRRHILYYYAEALTNRAATVRERGLACAATSPRSLTVAALLLTAI